MRGGELPGVGGWTGAVGVRQTGQGRGDSPVSSNTSLFIMAEGHDEKSSKGMME